MRTLAQSIKNQTLHAGQLRIGILGNYAAIGAIGEAPDAETHHRHRTMHQGNRNDRHAENFKRRVVNGDQINLRFAVRRVRRVFKRIGKHAFQAVDGALRAITWQSLLVELIESSYIVEAADMISVMMSVEYRVDAIDVIGKALQSQFRGGIDEQVQVADFEPDAGPRAVVVRVCRSAHGAVASDHGDAMRSSTA